MLFIFHYYAKGILWLDSKLHLHTKPENIKQVFVFLLQGYHYQMKMHVFNRKQADNADPTFHVKLYGAHNDTGDMFVDV